MSDHSITQAKAWILSYCLPQIKAGDSRVVIPCHTEDLGAFMAAMELPEVKDAIALAGVEVSAMAIRVPLNRVSRFFFPLVD